MVSHEREMTEPPYVRKERLAPFRASEEYDRNRAEVLQLEAQGREAIAAGDKEKAAALFMEMSRKSEQLGKYTQRWDAIDDYARCCIAQAEVTDSPDMAEEAAGILRRLIRECPEEKAYREQFGKAEAVYRKAVKEAWVKTGFKDDESPIVFYHSFEPKFAEVYCRLLEERFRERGGKRQIEFRWQEAAPSGWADYGEAQRETTIRWQVEDDDTEHEIGDICCCDLPTMTKLYYTKGNIREISPFIDTDDMFPEFLEQCRIEGDVCGIPVLMFAGAAGFWPCFAIGSIFCYGLKRLDCLDLMMLMTDSDFLSDVCRACNEEGETPHVFPADRTVCARLAEKEPGYAVVSDK
jgi:hypothetical protein